MMKQIVGFNFVFRFQFMFSVSVFFSFSLRFFWISKVVQQFKSLQNNIFWAMRLLTYDPSFCGNVYNNPGEFPERNIGSSSMNVCESESQLFEGEETILFTEVAELESNVEAVSSKGITQSLVNDEPDSEMGGDDSEKLNSIEVKSGYNKLQLTYDPSYCGNFYINQGDTKKKPPINVCESENDQIGGEETVIFAEVKDVSGKWEVEATPFKPSSDIELDCENNDKELDFEETIRRKKLAVEKAAEERARIVFLQRQNSKVNLEQAIDLSLKEYAELHEKAHTLRLQFEAERNIWTTKVLQESRAIQLSAGSNSKRNFDGSQKSLSLAAVNTDSMSVSFYEEFEYTIDTVEEQQILDTYPTPQKPSRKKFVTPLKLVLGGK
jgi:hypothetical protein